MNYIKLNIGGKERGAKLGLGFLEKALKGEKIGVQELFLRVEQEALTFLPKLLFYSLAFNCERANEKIDFDIYDVMDWVDEIGINSDEFKKFQISFYESIKTHLPEDAQQSIDDAVEVLKKGNEKPRAKSGKLTGK